MPMKRMRFILLLALLSLHLVEGAAAELEAGAGTVSSAAATDEKMLVDMMETARQAMYEHDYNRAIRVYTELAEMPDHLYRRDAMESLGLAFERAADVDGARAVYERYIQLYPQGEDSDRVHQRLAGLVTAEWARPKQLEKKAEPKNWRSYGSLFQFVRRSGSSTDEGGMVIGQHAVITSLDINSRGREGGVDIKSRVTGSHLYDLLDDPTEHMQLLSYLYLDLSQRSSGLHGRVGRQRANGGGVLGRFDGVNLGLRFTPKYALNMVAGLPVDRTADTHLNTTRKFRGVSIEGGPWNDYWLANGYYIEQLSEGFVDRRAVGAELRYMHPQRSLYTLIDYDIYFGTLNIFSNQMSWTGEDQTTYNLLLDYRNAPPVTARIALLGQSATTLQLLHDNYKESEIQQLAQDRTPHYYMLSTGFSHPFGEQYRWEGDVTATRLSETPASGGVLESAAIPVEFYYSARFSASNYFKQGDVNILGLYLTDGATNRSLTLSLNSRLPLGEHWYVDPRLQLGVRRQSETGERDRITGAGVRIEYELQRTMLLEFDGSTDWINTQTLLGARKSESFYVTAGYRWMF